MCIHRIFILLVLFAFLPAPGLCAERPLITLEGGGESVTLTAEEIRSGKQAALEAAMPDQVQFILRRGAPNGTDLTALYGDSGENLLVSLPPGMQGFDAYGEMMDGFSLQVAIRDVNGDEKPEVLVAAGDGASVLTVAVFVYTPQGDERFRCAAVIEGRYTLHVDAQGGISVPHGPQGPFTEYAVAADGAITKKR